MSSSETGTDTDTISNTESSTSGSTLTINESLGAGGVLTAGFEDGNSSEIVTATNRVTDNGLTTSSMTARERSSVGNASMTDYQSDGNTVANHDSDTNYESSSLTEASHRSMGIGGVELSGNSSSTLNSQATDYPSNTDTIVHNSSGSGSMTNVVGGDTIWSSTSEWGSETETATHTGIANSSEGVTGSESTGAGGVVVSGVEDSNTTGSDTLTDHSNLTGTDTSKVTGSRTYQVAGNWLYDYSSDAPTVVSNDSGTNYRTATVSESGHDIFGIGGVAQSATNSSTLLDSGSDLTTNTETLVDLHSANGSVSEVAGEDCISSTSSSSGSGTTTTIETGTDTVGGNATTTEYLGVAGVLVSGVRNSYSIATGIDVTSVKGTSTQTITQAGKEHQQEAGALATDDQSDQETITASIVASTKTDYHTMVESGVVSQTYGGSIAGGNSSSTKDEWFTITTTLDNKGTESFGDTASQSLLEGLDENDDAPTDNMTGSFGGTDTANKYVTFHATTTQSLMAGGTIAGGNHYEVSSETGVDTSKGSVTETDSYAKSGHGSYRVGASAQSEQSNDRGQSRLSLGDTGNVTVTASSTTTESFGNNAVVTSGNKSFSSSEYSNDSPSSTDTATDTEEIDYAGGDNLVDITSSTETITDSGNDGTTLVAFGTITLGTSGSIVGGSQTQTFDMSSSDGSGVASGTGSENDADTSSSISGTWTPHENGGTTASLHEVEVDFWTTLGAIASGSMTYALSYGSSDSVAPHLVGSETIAGQAGDPSQVVTITLDSPASFSYADTETGSVTLGSLGTIISGSDSYTWDEYRSTGVDRHATMTSITIDEVGTDSYRLHETGKEFEGVNGVITSGSDDFTWDQGGNNSYKFQQKGRGDVGLGRFGRLAELRDLDQRHGQLGLARRRPRQLGC